MLDAPFAARETQRNERLRAVLLLGVHGFRVLASGEPRNDAPRSLLAYSVRVVAALQKATPSLSDREPARDERAPVARSEVIIEVDFASANGARQQSERRFLCAQHFG
jgi:hypothetical protein